MAYNQAAIESGLNYILEHMAGNIFPRTISTKSTEGKQILVSNKEEALTRFRQANLLDCRISAYPPNPLENPIASQRFVGLREITPSNIIVMVDLDHCNFKSSRALDMALTRTLNTIKEKLDASPTVLYSGRGYHVIQSINSTNIVLENTKQFTDTPNISLHFLRFAESYLSAKKSDLQHNATVSFNNCMLRIPGSINSKNCYTVNIVRRWDKRRPEINRMLLNFKLYMTNKRYLEIIKLNNSRHQKNTVYNDDWNTNKILWIERLLDTPLADSRKYCVWRILTPYLLNKRKLPSQVAFNIIHEWLHRCNKLRRLDFNIQYRVNDSIERAVSKYMPVAFDKLRDENPALFERLNLPITN